MTPETFQVLTPISCILTFPSPTDEAQVILNAIIQIVGLVAAVVFGTFSILAYRATEAGNAGFRSRIENGESVGVTGDLSEWFGT